MRNELHKKYEKGAVIAHCLRHKELWDTISNFDTDYADTIDQGGRITMLSDSLGEHLTGYTKDLAVKKMMLDANSIRRKDAGTLSDYIRAIMKEVP